MSSKATSDRGPAAMHTRPEPARVPRVSGSQSKRTVEVELAGRRFRVRSDDDDRYIRELTDFVNTKLVDLRKSSNLIEGEQVALLALLDVADALFRERARSKDLVSSVRSRSERVLALLDQLHDVAPEISASAELVAAEVNDPR